MAFAVQYAAADWMVLGCPAVNKYRGLMVLREITHCFIRAVVGYLNKQNNRRKMVFNHNESRFF